MSVTNVLYKNIDELIKESLNEISTIVSRSLGYYGNTTILEDKLGGHTITKDGYTILNRIKVINDPLKSTLLDLVKNISRDLVKEVGDGSTSSVVIANSLYNELLILKQENPIFKCLPNKIILEKLEELEKVISEKILQKSTKINESNFDKVKNIAKISLNNDEKIANIILEIYEKIGKDGNILIEKSPTNKTFYELIQGYELNRGYVSNKFINQSNRKECIIESPYILLSDDTLDNSDLAAIVDLLGKLYQEGRGLVIISRAFSTEFINCFTINKSKNPNLEIALVDYSFITDNAKEKFEDLAAYIDGHVYEKSVQVEPITQTELYYKLGTCEKIKISENITYIIGGNKNEERVNARLSNIDLYKAEIEKEVNKRNIEKEIIQLNNRYSLLTGRIARLNVGGVTDIEKDTLKYLVEDAVYACKSALKYGYVSGGNLTIPKIIEDMLNYHEDSNVVDNEVDRTLLRSIQKACIEAYKTMLNNSSLFSSEEDLNNLIELNISEDSIYNLKTLEFENSDETDVINSCMTDIMILRSSLSIIGLIVTSNQFISNDIIRN